MHRIYDSKFRTDRMLLGPGEYFATGEGLVLHTVLGSCIAVCLWDPEKQIGGMNHFMLPAALDPNATFYSDAGRYGMHAMELLINKMLTIGADRARMVAKVFGGAHVLATGSDRSRLPDSNTAFALEYLATESIPVVAKDVGGNTGRQVHFAVPTGTVYVKKLDSSADIAKRERKYRVELPATSKTVELFEDDSPRSSRRRFNG